jgi:hypothetical protein
LPETADGRVVGDVAFQRPAAEVHERQPILDSLFDEVAGEVGLHGHLPEGMKP